MNVILRYLPSFGLWVVYVRGPLDIYWTMAMHETRDGAINMLAIVMNVD